MVKRLSIRLILVTLVLCSVVLSAACNKNISTSRTESVTISPGLFHSDQYNIEVQLPSGWAAAEGPGDLGIVREEGLVSFNNWGQNNFWARAKITDNPDGSRTIEYGPHIVASQVPVGGAYVALLHISGPPRALDDQPTEYTLDDLSGLYQPHDWRQDSANYAYFKTFYKNNSDLTLVIACHKNASDETVAQLNELLRSWRFIAE
jgi:hypothetical protein